MNRRARFSGAFFGLVVQHSRIHARRASSLEGDARHKKMVAAAARAFAVPPRSGGDASGATRRLAPRRGGRREVPSRGRVGGRPADATGWRPVTLGDVDELGVARSPESDTGEPSACVTFDSPRALMERFALVLERTPLESDVPPHEARLMRHALSRHPDARRKVGRGVSRIRVRAHDTRGYRYFELTRADGTTDDVSFRKCVAALFPGFGSGAYREGAGVANGDVKKTPAGAGVAKARGAALLTSLILEQTSVRGVLSVLILEGDEEVLAALRGGVPPKASVSDVGREKLETSTNGKKLRASLDAVHVAAALVKIGKLACEGDTRDVSGELRSSTYGALVETARAMCADGRFDARATANVAHAIAKTFVSSTSKNSHRSSPESSFQSSESRFGNLAYGNLAKRTSGDNVVSDGVVSQTVFTDQTFSARDALPANVYGLMAALEARVVAVAEDMSPQAVANALWGFATARWELGEESWRALQTQVARCGGGGDLKRHSSVLRDERDARFFRGGEEKNAQRRQRTTFNAQETANVAWAIAKLGWSPEENTWVGLNFSVATTARFMDGRAIAVTLWAYATLGERPSEDARDALESAARRVAIDSFSRDSLDDGSERERVTKETFRARDVSNIWWAFVTLELAPRDATRIALARVSARILTESPDLTPADVANQSWAIAALEHLESEVDDDDARRRAAHGETRARHSTRHAAATSEWCRAVETAEARLFSFFAQGEGSEKAPFRAEVREKRRVSPSDVSGAMLNVAANSARRARLRRREPSAEEAWRALERAAVALCREREHDKKISPQDLSNIWYAYASVGRVPEANAFAALELATAAASSSFAARHVAAALYAYAKIGFGSENLFGSETDTSSSSHSFLAALDKAAARVAESDDHEMNAQTLAQTLWGACAIASLGDGKRPKCVRSLWRAATKLDRRSILDVTLCTFFHAKLMCEELLADENDSYGDSRIVFPRWMDGDAKRAWIENAVDDVDVSGTHFLVWESLKDVLPNEEVVLECLTADECFSLDVYVPHLDLGVEVDGPTHYAETDSFTDPNRENDLWVPPRRRTSSTRLRDAFLARRMKTLIIVPWFEFHAVDVKGRVAYLRSKLRDAGVDA
jgi:hypothetical protein